MLSHDLSPRSISPTSIPTRSVSLLMIGAIILVPWATVPAVELITPLGFGSTFAIAWLSTLVLLAIFRTAYPNAFSTDIEVLPGSIRQWGWVIPRSFAAVFSTSFAARWGYPRQSSRRPFSSA